LRPDVRQRSEPGGVELEDRIAAVKERLSAPDVAARASPEKGMEMLRRGRAKNELRTLRQKRTFTKPRKSPRDEVQEMKSRRRRVDVKR
jgi:hypothetical protein